MIHRPGPVALTLACAMACLCAPAPAQAGDAHGIRVRAACVQALPMPRLLADLSCERAMDCWGDPAAMGVLDVATGAPVGSAANHLVYVDDSGAVGLGCAGEVVDVVGPCDVVVDGVPGCVEAGSVVSWPVGAGAGTPAGEPDDVGSSTAPAERDAVASGELSTGGALPRMATIWDLNASSWASISARERDVIVLANWRSWFHTSPSARSSSSPGSSSTESTSWLAMAAVMHW